MQRRWFNRCEKKKKSFLNRINTCRGNYEIDSRLISLDGRKQEAAAEAEA